MAYGKKYHTTVWNKGLGQITVDIYRKNYSGTVDPLTIAKEGVSITVDTVDYFETIASTSVDIDIINDKTDFYELDPLFSTSDLEHYIVIYTATVVLFRGFIPCDVTEQAWLPKGTITISATCNLNRLDEYTPTLLETKGTYSLLEIMQHCLSFTNMEISGSELPVYVNCSLREITKTTGTSTCFDQTWADSDIFYEDSTTLRDCKTVMEYILGAFDCIIYYYNDGWYIERWKDLAGYAEVKTYIKYWESTVTLVEDDIPASLYPQVGKGLDVFCIEQSQRISYSPGLKSVEVTLDETLRLNLVDYYYDDIVTTKGIDSVELITPTYGYWEAVLESDIYTETGHYLDNMTNYVTLVDTWSGRGLLNGRVVWMYTDYYADALRRTVNGIFAKVKIHMNEQDSTNPTEDVTTTITVACTMKLSDAYVTEYGASIKEDPSWFKFWFRFFLRYDDGTGHPKWIKYNTTNSEYELVTLDNMTAGGYDMPIIKQSVLYTEFTNKTEFYTDVTVSVSLGNAIHTVVGDNPVFVLGILPIAVTDSNWNHEDELPNLALLSSTFGDIYVTANTDVDDNVVTGSITSDFVTVEEDTMYLYDSSNFSISNGLYTNADRDHTVSWKDSFSSIYLPLSKHFIQDRFQIYNVVRRHIISDVMAYRFLKPFEMMDGNLLNKVFCVNGYKYIVDSDRYESIKLSEYVNDDDVS
jgi:hypothetical protein